MLGEEYGPVEWRHRYDPASELVYTILSQHTSDINSERAFNNLMDTFGTVEAIASAPVEDIEDAIRMGGLAKVKAPRIKTVLQQIAEELGSFDLSFLGEMPLSEAKDVGSGRFPGVGPQGRPRSFSASPWVCPLCRWTLISIAWSKRLGLIGQKVTADQAHDILEPMVASEDVFRLPHVISSATGRQVCKAQRPHCDDCALAWGCPSPCAIRCKGEATD